MKLAKTANLCNDFFSLSVSYDSHATYIQMQVFSPTINTASLPHTYHILDRFFPDFKASACVNTSNIPFDKEVRSTEIGHLFEHILLSYIYKAKREQGKKRVKVTGETSWNWYQYPTGFFSITITLGAKERSILFFALAKTIHLIEYIFMFHEKEYSENAKIDNTQKLQNNYSVTTLSR
jgi:hypothetical protein